MQPTIGLCSQELTNLFQILQGELIPDNSKLTLLLYNYNRQSEKETAHFISHIQPHIEFPGPLAERNTEIDQLLIGNVLEALEFRNTHHVNRKSFYNLATR